VTADGMADPRAYVQIAVSVRQQIADGTLAAGRPVPSITTLCQQTGRSRQTAGKALRLLEREGLITRVAGHGYYVAGAAGVAGQ
jgi:DNA-binding GntR family transcriptional regulator